MKNVPTMCHDKILNLYNIVQRKFFFYINNRHYRAHKKPMIAQFHAEYILLFPATADEGLLLAVDFSEECLHLENRTQCIFHTYKSNST